MSILMWAVMGRSAGVAGARSQNRQPPESDSAVLFALSEAPLGVSAVVQWKTRPRMQAAGRGEKKRVEAVRGADWLFQTPIHFG